MTFDGKTYENGLPHMKWQDGEEYNGTNKKQKKLPMALQKAILKTKTNKEKESEEVMPYHTGHGKKKKGKKQRNLKRQV